MNTNFAKNPVPDCPIEGRLTGWRQALVVSWVLFGALQNVPASCNAAEPLFRELSSAARGDEIVLLSTRSVGTVCDPPRLRKGLHCQRLKIDGRGQPTWQTMDWRALLADSGPCHSTIIYVHGNRVPPGKDQARGLNVYRSLRTDGNLTDPIRFIIWSWPSTPIPGPVKDFRVKATYTAPAAWQLGWFLDQLPRNSQIALIGYSYGARIVSGALHLAGGGALDHRRLPSPRGRERPAIRAALIAAAYDVDWIQPGNEYGRSTNHLERLVLSTNRQDPAMRFYHLSNGRGRVHALGRTGIEHAGTLRPAKVRVREVNFTNPVGRNHGLAEYLKASKKMGTLWHQLLAETSEPPLERVATIWERLP
ncbi:MAG: hypothetical protein MK171_05735 [Pirellulales bacterium]|nr:hypothetical protein [Pirellulales bacterium]